MSDWIDEEKARRDHGQTRALGQDQHASVNARYPGCTREHCFICDEETGKAGRGEDSIYDDDNGPYCEECFAEHEDTLISEAAERGEPNA